VNGVLGKVMCVEDGVEILSDPVAFVVVLSGDTKGTIMLVKLDILS
jgi:hypothetical protein